MQEDIPLNNFLNNDTKLVVEYWLDFFSTIDLGLDSTLPLSLLIQTKEIGNKCLDTPLLMHPWLTYFTLILHKKKKNKKKKQRQQPTMIGNENKNFLELYMLYLCIFSI